MAWRHAMQMLAAAWVLGSLACRAPDSRLGGSGVRIELEEELELLMGSDLRAARQIGASEPRLGLAGLGIPGDSLGGFLSLPADACAFVLARGSSGVQDLDLFAFGDDGSVLASDESAARDAVLLFCPPQPARAFISGRVSAGFGLFGVSAQLLAPDQAGALSRRFGVVSRQPAQPQELDSNWPGLDEHLAEHRRRLGGTWESVRKIALPLDPRLYVHVSASVEAQGCVDLLVSPSEDVAHLELEVLEANGRWIGTGQARAANRDLMVCSSEKRELTIRCRPHAGRGLAALVISRLSAGTASELSSHAARFDLRPQGELVDLRAAHAAQLEAAGYGKAIWLRAGQLEPERRKSVPLTLLRGCSRIDVLSAAPVQSLRTWLWDADGRLLSEGQRGSQSTLFACGPASSARLDLESVARGGAFAAELRHSPALPPLAERYRTAAARLLATLAARGLLPSLARLPDLGSSELVEDQLSRVPLRVRAGQCLAFSAALDRGTSGLEVRLFENDAASPGEPAAEELEVAYGAHAVSVRICAVKPARERLFTAELRANVGRGTALWASQELDPEPHLKGPQAR
jgi:hypothetical protein